MSGSRLFWIDFVRTIGIWLVVWGHFLPNCLLKQFIYAFHVPMFFIVSGYLSDYLHQGERKLRFMGLLVPYVTWTGISIIAYMAIGRTSVEVFGWKYVLQSFLPIDGFVNWNAPLWFLYALFVVEAIAPRIDEIKGLALGRMGDWWRFSLLGIAFFALGLIDIEFDINIFAYRQVCLGVVFYLTGACLNRFHLMSFLESRMPLAILIALAGCVAGWLNGKISIWAWDVGRVYLLFLSGALLTTTFMLVAHRNEKRLAKMSILKIVSDRRIIMMTLCTHFAFVYCYRRFSGLGDVGTATLIASGVIVTYYFAFQTFRVLKRADISEGGGSHFFWVFPRRSFFVNTQYALWRLLRRSLILKRVIYQNGETVPDKTGFLTASKNARCPNRIVCVTGFGHSGSGVINDLLSEYDGMSVQGFLDKNGSLREDSGMEFDLLRHAGGLFDIERAMQSENAFIQDGVIKAFIALVAYYYYNPKCTYRETLLRAAKKFLSEVIDVAVASGSGYEYCPHLRVLGEKGYELFYGQGLRQRYIYTLRQMEVSEFRKVGHDFLLSILPEISSGDFLILDQVVSDFTADIKKYREYLGPIKLIAVYRDPRDVFATGLKLNETWIPHDVEVFINWYRRQVVPYCRLIDMDYLLLRFEDIVLDYDSEVAKVESFVGVSPKTHTKPRSAFDPSVSGRNIGIYKTLVSNEDAECIATALKDFCFNG